MLSMLMDKTVIAGALFALAISAVVRASTGKNMGVK